MHSHRQQTPDRKRAAAAWALRMGLLFTVLIAVALAAGLVYYRAKGVGGTETLVIGGRQTTVVPNVDLSPAERAYLRGYLLLHAADIEEPAGTDATLVRFAVEPGEPATGIVGRLEAAGMLVDATLFRYYLRYYDLDAKLEAGEFELRATMTIPEIAQTLTHALAEEVEIRIPEGWRLEQIADHLAQNPDIGIDPNQFLLLARRPPASQPAEGGQASGANPGQLHQYDFLQAVPAGATLEGYLFPDTYRLPADATAADLVNTMLSAFSQRVPADLQRAMADQGLTLHGAVTLASIVEREAQLPEERPIIASVFLNRLAQGIKLDADPTVQYALGYQGSSGDWWKHPLLYADLEVESPYNTYRYAGLPPGPIASPGLASIEAVARPAETRYLFFVVDCTAEVAGRHAFAESFEEHQAHAARCQ